jgi:integrase
VHGLFESNPIDRVARTPAKQSRVAFFELDAVERIVAAQMTPELQAFYAIAYGAGIETGVTLNLTRADVWEATQQIRAAGTKAHTRDRLAKVSRGPGRSSGATPSIRAAGSSLRSGATTR